MLMSLIEPSSPELSPQYSPKFSPQKLPKRAQTELFFVDKQPQPQIQLQPILNEVPDICAVPQIQHIQSEYKLDFDASIEVKSKKPPKSSRPCAITKDFNRMKLAPLKDYRVPVEIEAIEESGRQQSDEWLELQSKFAHNVRSDRDTYFEAYTTMIHLEEAAQSKFLNQFKANGIRIEHADDGMFCFENNTSKLDDAINNNLLDQFILRPVRQGVSIEISGQIKSCNRDYIFVRFSGNDFSYIHKNCHTELYDIVFHINRTPFQLQHTALEWMQKHNLFDCLINNPAYDTEPTCRDTDYDDYDFRGLCAPNLNEEQQMAVRNIVSLSNFPLPYLLLGPAGTGKTGTLVAAVEEIVRSSDKCVLICSNSNAACDEITERLLHVLKASEMFRFYASSFDARKTSERIKQISNWNVDSFSTPALDYLYKFRVLICTLCTAGILVRSNRNSIFKPDHFSHVIIDESASTHETMALIPIAGLCSSLNEIKSSLVLAGDPKQLDAVTKSTYAAKLGYKISFMEQLLTRNFYNRNSRTGEYNQNYITQLVKNYRSHSAILSAANMLFYDNKLQVRAPKDITDWYIGSNLLPFNNKFPVIFHSVQGFCRKASNDFSLFNSKEAETVINYIQKLLRNTDGLGKPVTELDIGVVTPYKLQSKVIARACRRNAFDKITVGTAEVFQGQEKPVMIVSTVCTKGILGFVKDPRRMNVIITRAKCLLIIVGDPHTLSKDPNWKKLIEYCIKNRAFVQGDRPYRIKITAP